MNVLEIRHLSKKFDDEKILDDVTLVIKRGDVVGFIGENGCGKSVLFKMICGFISVDMGSINVMGRKIECGEFPLNTGIFLDGTGFCSMLFGF